MTSCNCTLASCCLRFRSLTTRYRTLSGVHRDGSAMELSVCVVLLCLCLFVGCFVCLSVVFMLWLDFDFVYIVYIILFGVCFYLYIYFSWPFVSSLCVAVFVTEFQWLEWSNYNSRNNINNNNNSNHTDIVQRIQWWRNNTQTHRVWVYV